MCSVAFYLVSNLRANTLRTWDLRVSLCYGFVCPDRFILAPKQYDNPKNPLSLPVVSGLFRAFAGSRVSEGRMGPSPLEELLSGR